VHGLARLGVVPAQIETVILTHFHADHVGGLRDLPQARVICAKAGYDAMTRKGRIKNATEGVFAALLPEDLTNRLSFVESSAKVDLPLKLGQGWDIAGDGSLVAVDLPGHLEGHIGLCFPQLTQPFLYAVDVQWMLDSVLQDRCPGFRHARAPVCARRGRSDVMS
jgi:glyoxylase-like metal-dependent hydrolase (beta-lactamase superfamily II)